MKLNVFLEAMLFVVLVNYTAAAQKVLKIEADSIPVLEEWWRAPTNIIGMGRSISFLPNFYNGKDAVAIQVSEKVGVLPEFHTWLNRFPGDTQNVFTWKAGYIKSGDFNGDGITDYIDGDGNIYQGIQNGMPPETEPVRKYGVNGTILDVNNDGYDDVYFTGVLYGGPDLADLKFSSEPQSPTGSFYRKVRNIYKTPEGEIRLHIQNYKKREFDHYELYKATWPKGSTQAVFEKLDSITHYLYNEKDYYFGLGDCKIYQSKQSAKTYLIAAEKFKGNQYESNLVIYDLSNDSLTQTAKIRMDEIAGINILEHSIDGDQYEDWCVFRMQKEGENKLQFFSGNENLDLKVRSEYNGFCSGGLSLIQSISDVTGDSINDLVISSGGNFVPNCLRFVKGMDLTTDISFNDKIEQNFSLKTFKTTSTYYTISFTLLKESYATFSLFDMEGKLVKVLKEGMFDAVEQSFTWDSGDMPQGAYLLQLSANGKTATEKILIAK